MNIQEMELVNVIKNHSCKTQRELSLASGYSLGKINSILKDLTDGGYVDRKMNLTEK